MDIVNFGLKEKYEEFKKLGDRLSEMEKQHPIISFLTLNLIGMDS